MLLCLTCNQESFFFAAGKERLIQLLDYSSAAPEVKQIKISAVSEDVGDAIR